MCKCPGMLSSVGISYLKGLIVFPELEEVRSEYLLKDELVLAKWIVVPTRRTFLVDVQVRCELERA